MHATPAHTYARTAQIETQTTRGTHTRHGHNLRCTQARPRTTIVLPVRGAKRSILTAETLTPAAECLLFLRRLRHLAVSIEVIDESSTIEQLLISKEDSPPHSVVITTESLSAKTDVTRRSFVVYRHRLDLTDAPAHPSKPLTSTDIVLAFPDADLDADTPNVLFPPCRTSAAFMLHLCYVHIAPLLRSCCIDDAFQVFWFLPNVPFNTTLNKYVSNLPAPA